MREIRVKLKRQKQRIDRTRNKILVNKTLPRLTVFRSNKNMYAQIIDDAKGMTLVAVNGADVADAKANKTAKATELGRKIAEKAVAAKIKNVVFDRGSYRYHGRVKALADAAREGGLVF